MKYKATKTDKAIRIFSIIMIVFFVAFGAYQIFHMFMESPYETITPKSYWALKAQVSIFWTWIGLQTYQRTCGYRMSRLGPFEIAEIKAENRSLWHILDRVEGHVKKGDTKLALFAIEHKRKSNMEGEKS